jgi:aspartate-semialdehyde dehydrogenase
VGAPGPEIRGGGGQLHDARAVEVLAGFDALVSCQGGDYTKAIYPALRAAGWRGYWIDAASALRMDDEAVLILDPVNRRVIDDGLAHGKATFCGPNCTTSLMLMALVGLYRAGLVEWISTMTYQAASGAGARHMRELIEQMAWLAAPGLLDAPALAATELDRRIAERLRDPGLPRDNFGYPLAANLLPWIDTAVEGGQTREEWKGYAESNKILGNAPAIPVDGQCVRVGAMRCHSQAMTIKLRRAVPLDELGAMIAEAHPWVSVVDNSKEATLSRLTPAAVTGTLEVPVGRLRTMRMGPDYLTAFTVGDQLLWGAAEPLRRMLRIVREHRGG